MDISLISEIFDLEKKKLHANHLLIEEIQRERDGRNF